MKLTQPENALLAEFAQQDRVTLCYSYQRDHYDVVLPSVYHAYRLKWQNNAYQRLIERGIVSGGAFSGVLPDYYLPVYGASFEFLVTRALEDEYRRVLQHRNETRAYLDEIIDGNVSDYRLNLIWNLYHESHYTHPDPAVRDRHERWIASGKQGLLFLHTVTDAFKNDERSLQSLEQWQSAIALWGVRGAIQRHSTWYERLF